MTKTSSSQQEDYRHAFLRHLANRSEAIAQRIRRFCREGWEFNGLSMLHDDVQRLAGASGRYDLIGPSLHLLRLEQLLGEHIARKSLPVPQQYERVLALVAEITASLVAPAGTRRTTHADPVAESSPQQVGTDGTEWEELPASAMKAADGTIRSTPSAWNAASHVLLLSDGNPLASEVGQRLATEGFKVETLASIDDLPELLMVTSPALVLVDCSHMADLIAIGTARRDIQRLTPDGDEMRLVALAAQDNLQSRLDAGRAGVDLLLFPPFSANEVLRQVQRLLTPTLQKKVRVLIVEDDRAQALFAQGVLVKAGMRAQIELQPMHVLEALEALRPDMVLMDIHMPHANGVELTAMIRDHPTFMHTPIVFLTGESNPDARFEAINAGGDDFLSKPIRPEQLVAAVNNRVRRMRALEKRDRMLGARDDATGLYRRAYLFDHLNDALGASMDQRADQGGNAGGALFLEIDGAAELRDRLGLAALEHLLVAAGGVLADAVGEQYVAGLINENAFVVLATDLDDDALDALAQRLRSQLMQHPFEEGGKPIQLNASVGICPLRFGFDDASALLNTAERVCREARIGGQGVKRYRPPDPSAISQGPALAEQLREAIGGNGFGLIYQPIAAIQGGEEEQYQTLLRMRDASGRLLPAAEILPLAERAGLMIDIDRWVLNRAMKVLQQQRDMGRAVRLFVPQAMTTFAAKEQDLFLRAELAAHELSGSALVLEIRLEDALLNPPALMKFANAMLADGVQLCLVQYEHTPEASSLLEQISLGFIKLAAKYVVEDAPQALRDELRILSDRAHRFGIQVIGHRVEDARTAATLWMSGIDYIQGNLVQSPADALNFDFNAAVL